MILALRGRASCRFWNEQTEVRFFEPSDGKELLTQARHCRVFCTRGRQMGPGTVGRILLLSPLLGSYSTCEFMTRGESRPQRKTDHGPGVLLVSRKKYYSNFLVTIRDQKGVVAFRGGSFVIVGLAEAFTPTTFYPPRNNS